MLAFTCRRGVKNLKRKPVSQQVGSTAAIDLSDETTGEPPACKKNKTVSSTQIAQLDSPEVGLVACDAEEQFNIH